MAKGLNRYFTGRPCKWGHITERSVNGGCVQCIKKHNDKRPKKTRKPNKYGVSRDEYKKLYAKDYYKNNKEYFQRKGTEYRKTHSSYLKEQNKIWKQKNRKKHCELNKKSRLRHLEKTRERAKKYLRNNPHVMRVCGQNRRAREMNAEGFFTKKDIERIYKAQRSKCACCKSKLIKYHVDHIIPLYLGGTNWPKNLQLLCPPCNQEKHAKDPIDFMRERGFLL